MAGFIQMRRDPFRELMRSIPRSQRAATWAFWHEALMRANYEYANELERGQFVFGRDEMAKTLGISVSTVRTIVRRLVAASELTTVSTGKGTTATICKYDTYINTPENNGQQIYQQIDHSEEIEKIREIDSTPPTQEFGEVRGFLEAEGLVGDLEELGFRLSPTNLKHVRTFRSGYDGSNPADAIRVMIEKVQQRDGNGSIRKSRAALLAGMLKEGVLEAEVWDWRDRHDPF